jgi:hypothetical protein
MIVLISAANAVNNRHTLRLPTILEEDFALGWSCSTGHSLKLKSGQDIIIPSITILWYAPGVEKVITCGKDN